ncbi:MAG TPA: hypothetical protein V6D29_05840 [Leptolyngbyaceae cyanobacterium]
MQRGIRTWLLPSKHGTLRRADKRWDAAAHQRCIHQLKHRIFRFAQLLIQALVELAQLLEEHRGQCVFAFH